MGGHRLGICNDQESKIFYEHFTRGTCNGYGFTVQIIQKLSGNGRISNGVLGVDNGAVPKKGAMDVECTAQTEKCKTD